MTNRRAARTGLSLLEVILAMAILTMAITVLGELARLGMRSASYARDMTQAQLLCESKMAQISSGMILPETEIDVPFEPDDLIDPYEEVTWVYSVETGEVDETGLIAVRVTVSKLASTSLGLASPNRPIQFALVRWIVDPQVELSATPLFEIPEAEGDSSADAGGGGDRG
jgi:hypothetical protein